MYITPNEILEKEFTVRFRGYDREEVEAFLEEVANFLAAVIKERNELKDRVLTYKKQITILKQQEVEFRRALTAAHKAAEDMKAGAKKKAELIIERAKLDADRIVADAHQEAIALEDRIRHLRMLQRETVYKMRSSFEGFLRILDEEMALPPQDVDETLKMTADEVRAIQEDRPMEEAESTEEVVHARDHETSESEGKVSPKEEAESVQPQDALKESPPDQDQQQGQAAHEEGEQEEAEVKQQGPKMDFGFNPDKLWPDK